MRRTRFISRTVLLLCGFLTPTVVAAPNPDEVWESIRKQRELAALSAPSVPIFLEYSIEWHDTSEPEDIQAMRARVVNKPDHPDRFRLLQAERYAREGPPTTSVRVWQAPDGRGRWCADYASGDGPFIDRAIGRSVAWTLTPDHLTVSARDGEGSPPERNAATAARIEFNDVRNVLFGALAVEPRVAIVRSDLRIQGATWTIEAPVVSSATLILQGTWDEQTKSALGTDAIFVPDEGSALQAFSVSAAEWKYDAELKRALPGALQHDFGAGDRFRVLQVRSAKVFDEQEIDALTETPDPNGDDPVRGRVTFTSVLDYSGEVAFPAPVDLSGSGAPPGAQLASASGSWLRWGALAAALCITAWLAIRRFGTPRISRS